MSIMYEDLDMKKSNLLSSVTKPFAIGATAFLFAATPAFAEYNRGTLEEAVVLSAEPVYRTVRVNQPVEQCWDEPVRVQSQQRSYRSHTPKILGAVIGAAIGNRFGKGGGRDVATVAGAILGGSIGRDAQANHRTHHGNYQGSGGETVYEQRCELVDQFRTEQKLDGYDVTYRYNGQTYNTYSEYDPGQTITVSVNVTPVQ